MLDQQVFNTIFGAIEYTREETAAHYEGELAKLKHEQYDSLIQCWNRRPDLTEAEIVHIVERHRNENIVEAALVQFRAEVESFKQAVGEAK